MSSRISDTWRAWINEALPKIALNERAKWDCGLAIGPQGVGMLLTVSMPGMVVGTVMSHGMMVNQPGGATKEQVLGFVEQIVKQLRADRARQVAEAAGPPRPNGQPAPPGVPGPGGLILPG